MVKRGSVNTFKVLVNEVKLTVYEAGAGTPVLLLHGFTGSARSFERVFNFLSENYRVFALDLIGHGESDAPEDWRRYSVEAAVFDIKTLLERLGLSKIVVLGYSMGGRIALSFACEYPSLVQALILESASPGLVNQEAREARIKSDWALAERIVRDGVEKFVDYWENTPLFSHHASKNPQAAAREREIRLSQRARGLAGSLKGGGTGSQRPRWDELPLLEIPTLLLTGSQDLKFENIAEEMQRHMPYAQHARIPNAGHTIHLEAPGEFEAQIRTFLLQQGISS